MKKESKSSNKFNELRKNAELLYKRNPVIAGEMPSEEVHRLIEELHVHQIELEMQNEELRLAQSELVSARNRYEDLYDFAPVGYLTTGKESLILKANLTFCRLLNLDRSAVINTRFTDFILRDDQDKYYFHNQKVLDSDQKETCELELKKPDGTLFNARLESIIDKSSEADRNHIRTVVTDITRLRQLETQLRHSHKMEALGTLAGGVAHEFNNILHILLLNLNLLEQKTSDSDPARKYIESCQKTGKRAAEMIRQILSYTHKEEKQSDAINVIPVIEEAVKLVRSTLPAMIRVRLEKKVEMAMVQLKGSQIHQIIYNLCSNAGYAMRGEKGTITLTIDKVTLDADFASSHQIKKGEYLQLSVVDNGSGIEKMDLERIFDPFFTTKPVGEGTGMGLSVIQGIVKNIGGTITAFSEIGKGSRFNVFMPESEEIGKIEIDSGKSPQKGSGHVLLVDDEEMIIEMHAEILEDFGYEVTAVTSSIKALELFKKQPHLFDVVLTDHGIPEMTGLQLAEELLNLRKNFPVIILTGYDDQMIETEAKQIGVDQVIMKPLDQDTLGILLQETLNRKKPS
ncbi:response regulator [bacterium]|nr:response regulator [bacterium]